MVPAQNRTISTGGLNDIQISLLRLFDQGISEQEALEVREIMMDYFDKALKAELQDILPDKNYTAEHYRKMLSDDSFATE